MNLVKCKSGHFYDSESYRACPHCDSGPVGDASFTVPLQVNGGQQGAPMGNDNVTVPLMKDSQVTAPLSGSGGSLQDAVNAAVQPASRDENKTVGFFSSAIGKEPVVGWLVCTEGEHFGEDFRLKSGRNFIGRGADMDVSVSKDVTVSRERHAIVVYEPRSNVFLMQAGESKELCYLNGELVLSAQPLKVNDRILVGKTELMFIPCCSDAFNWDSEKK